jgi:hypothetical protein
MYRLSARHRSSPLSVLVVGLSFAAVPHLGEAQGGMMPGASDIAFLDFASSTPGPFATGGSTGPLRVLDGTLHIVDHLSQRMLRASSRTTLVLSLPRVLPRDFTLELDLVSKECCQPEDVAIEGSSSLIPIQSSTSANVRWSSESMSIVGGAPTNVSSVTIAGAVPGSLTNIMLSFRGDELTVYTNGQSLPPFANRLFTRGSTLRIFLGGQNDTDRAVYLARFRVAAGALTPTVATAASPLGSTSAAASTGSSTAPSSTQPFAGNVTVTPTANGPLVSWTPPNASRGGYQVVRWKSDDPACCVASSSTTPLLTTNQWLDVPPPVPGTYSYQVTAFASGGPYVMQGQFVYQGSGGQTITAPAGGNPTPQVGAGRPNQPTVTAPPAAGAGPVTAPSAGSPGTQVGAGRPNQPTVTAPPSAGAGPITAPPGGNPGSAPDPCDTQVTAATLANALRNPSTSGAASTQTCSANYRVTLTGFHAFMTTREPVLSPDGQGDEVYAAAAAVMWSRKSATVPTSSRTIAKTLEYGDNSVIGLPNRLADDNLPSELGISTGNGPEQVPFHYRPDSPTIPAHTFDRFPRWVWEGRLTDGDEALLLVPTLWERDVDPSVYRFWEVYWRTAPLASFFQDPALDQQIRSAGITQFRNPIRALGTPVDIALADLLASVKDHPIGTYLVGNPAIHGRYDDRLIILTREKLAGMAVGGYQIIPIQYTESQTTYTQGHYTLYLRIDRLP